MSKNFIDHIITDKLSGFNYEFKNEYWNQMQDKLDTECAQTNSCASSHISGFLSAGLMLTFATIISVILFSPWATNIQQPLNNNNDDCIDLIKTEKAIVPAKRSSSDDELLASTINKNKTQLASTKTTNNNNISSNKKKHQVKATNRRTKTVVKKKTSTKPTTVKSAKRIETIDNNNHTLIAVDSASIKKQPITLEEKVIISDPKPVTYEMDSIIIPDAELIGDKAEKTKKERQVNVESGLKPVKNVKTKSKPIKRVFKKRKGIFYRLGLRK